ncbi:MAG: glycosyltransferase family 2 protein [Candidatus Acidiferrales bacterium]
MHPQLPEKKNTCAVVVTFHPDADFGSRVAQIAGQAGAGVVVDNGSGEDCVRELRRICDSLGLHLIENLENRGIAAALNQGVHWAGEQGFEWVLTLDQDSLVADDLVARLSAVYKSFPGKEKLAIIGPNYRDANSEQLFLRVNGEGPSWQEVKTVITSGSLISLAACATIGPFREEFFMDCVDLEYCLRARAHGFKVVLARAPLMQHTIGAATMHKLPWKTTGTSNHSPTRRYYMTRNHLVLVREYLRKEPVWAFSTLYSRLKSTVLMCLFEKDRVYKLKYTATGAFDGVFSKFDRKVQ